MLAHCLWRHRGVRQGCCLATLGFSYSVGIVLIPQQLQSSLLSIPLEPWLWSRARYPINNMQRGLCVTAWYSLVTRLLHRQLCTTRLFPLPVSCWYRIRCDQCSKWPCLSEITNQFEHLWWDHFQLSRLNDQCQKQSNGNVSVPKNSIFQWNTTILQYSSTFLLFLFCFWLLLFLWSKVKTLRDTFV